MTITARLDSGSSNSMDLTQYGFSWTRDRPKSHCCVVSKSCDSLKYPAYLVYIKHELCNLQIIIPLDAVEKWQVGIDWS